MYFQYFVNTTTLANKGKYELLRVWGIVDVKFNKIEKLTSFQPKRLDITFSSRGFS